MTAATYAADLGHSITSGTLFDSVTPVISQFAVDLDHLLGVYRVRVYTPSVKLLHIHIVVYGDYQSVTDGPQFTVVLGNEVYSRFNHGNYATDLEVVIQSTGVVTRLDIDDTWTFPTPANTGQIVVTIS